jgi:hypothetical protein
MTIMKPTPTNRPDAVLLLQPWSTATTQTKKSMTEAAPKIFSHMFCSLPTKKVVTGHATLGVRASQPDETFLALQFAASKQTEAYNLA